MPRDIFLSRYVWQLSERHSKKTERRHQHTCASVRKNITVQRRKNIQVAQMAHPWSEENKWVFLRYLVDLHSVKVQTTATGSISQVTGRHTQKHGRTKNKRQLETNRSELQWRSASCDDSPRHTHNKNWTQRSTTVITFSAMKYTNGILQLSRCAAQTPQCQLWYLKKNFFYI